VGRHIAPDYAAGVLTLTIPVHKAAKPRNIQVTSSDRKQAVTALPGGTSDAGPANCGLARRGHRGLTGPRRVGRAA